MGWRGGHRVTGGGSTVKSKKMNQLNIETKKNTYLVQEIRKNMLSPLKMSGKKQEFILECAQDQP